MSYSVVNYHSMTKKCFPPFLCQLIIILASASSQAANEPPPTVFIFGDSTADVGTNTYIPQSRRKADFPHNGIDFPNSRATGRFSNGLNTADFVAQFFGLKRSPPPFLFLLTLNSHFKKHLPNGANFASGGAGILDSTGSNLTIVPLSEQINQFSTVRDNLTDLFGSSLRTEDTLSKSLFFISVGSNDIFAYFQTKNRPPADEFLATLISAYETHIINLYMLGARKFGIVSVSPVGCCPSQRLVQKKIYGVDGCFQLENDFAQNFYSALSNLLLSMSSQLPGFKYSLGNGYNMTMDVINNPTEFHFENVDSACCGSGALNAAGLCNKTASLCPNRPGFLFWDLFHPTMKGSLLAAQVLYFGPSYYVSPINFSQLAEEN